MIHEIITAVVTAVLVGPAFYIRGLRRHRKNADPKPICGCKHAVNFHENHTGRCRESWYDSWNSRKVTCDCQKYSGPVPLPTYYAGEIQ